MGIRIYRATYVAALLLSGARHPLSYGIDKARLTNDDFIMIFNFGYFNRSVFPMRLKNGNNDDFFDFLENNLSY